MFFVIYLYKYLKIKWVHLNTTYGLIINEYIYLGEQFLPTYFRTPKKKQQFVYLTSSVQVAFMATIRKKKSYQNRMVDHVMFSGLY